MKILKEILKELILTHRELQAIRNNLESKRFVPEDSEGIKDKNEASCSIRKCAR